VSGELERLGCSQTRGVLVTASDGGLCFSVNEGLRRALHAELVSGASLLVVAPFAREAVNGTDGQFGIQLALSSEHDLLELRPVTYSPSLLGGRGGFPVSADDAAEHADPEEVHREFRAQIEKAKVLGVEPVFLASHDDVVARQLSLFDVFLDLAEEYELPIRHGYDFGSIGLDAAALARDRGHFVAERTINWSSTSPESLDDLLDHLPVGISEIIVSPAIDGDELHAVLGDAASRSGTLRALGELSPRDLAARHNVAWLHWRQIAQLRNA
jgi:chitin disaccharide deacetylase